MSADTAPRIDLTKLDDALFQRLYEERIEPCFNANEAGRLDAIKQFKTRAMIGGGVALALAAITFVFAQEKQAAFVVLFIAAIFAGVIAYQPIANLSRKLKQEYCSAIAEAMGASFDIADFTPPAFDRIKALNLVPSYTRSKFEDCFRGSHKTSSYELYEAVLEQRRSSGKRTHYVTVFRGQLIRLHFPHAFEGTTIVRRDMGVFNAFGGGSNNGKKLERVRLVDPTFEKTFEVWGTDQVEARYLVHPVMMERLLELEKALHGKRIRCAFEGGDMLIAVEGGDLFEPGDLFKPLVDPARARRIVDEIASIVRVMDHVLTAQAQRPT
ncbi:MAG: DUF3137 domain-containing protein [Hyphomonadaceae bacterium]|nr:DUF3137 domain-containing protein [Hyphomonadaceae bacterium]